ncbi:hypothetical protein K437DRAFT_270938 [Tilletiaria anomala UBC 951]|uniref:Uncharacterized protein n=1 Tax=Tilletiaria anomala (strain ATCC 24038 / CBS 436.72 / UBC 951) TaxID=1037660 RepID=A0A066V6W0_TILAU|nr:uncharacterized protein K437DRAFT_270938 [Tilletiaria anomala UBC 951]KDN37216.1 hypothetical protein K437DRAFT_270938 [Tilletiaria anomala UBC 951]
MTADDAMYEDPAYDAELTLDAEMEEDHAAIANNPPAHLALEPMEQLTEAEAEMADVEDAEVIDTSIVEVGLEEAAMNSEALRHSAVLAKEEESGSATVTDAATVPVIPAEFSANVIDGDSVQTTMGVNALDASSRPRLLSSEHSHDDGHRADSDQPLADAQDAKAAIVLEQKDAPSENVSKSAEEGAEGDADQDRHAVTEDTSQGGKSEMESQGVQDDHDNFPAIRLTFDGHGFVIQCGDREGDLLSYVPAPGTSKESAEARTVAPGIKVPENLYLQPLEALFQQLRLAEALGEFLEDDTELILSFPDLDLIIPEDNIYAREVTLEDIHNLHVGCGLEHSLHILVTEGPRFINRFNSLSAQADAFTDSGEMATQTNGKLAAEEQEQVYLHGRVVSSTQGSSAAAGEEPDESSNAEHVYETVGNEANEVEDDAAVNEVDPGEEVIIDYDEAEHEAGGPETTAADVEASKVSRSNIEGHTEVNSSVDNGDAEEPATRKRHAQPTTEAGTDAEDIEGNAKRARSD